ncbi:MAG: hypothetical protein AAF493_27000 [Pseudomonadota bacterium]
MRKMKTASRDARRILAAVLQGDQRIVKLLIDRLLANNPDDSAHGFRLPLSGRRRLTNGD